MLLDPQQLAILRILGLISVQSEFELRVFISERLELRRHFLVSLLELCKLVTDLLQVRLQF